MTARDTFGTSDENNRFGCLDTDGDGWADVDDVFPEDGEQWKDADGDGYGDNYLWTITFIEDQDDEQRIIELREQRGDAFPTLPDEWSDQDGDGYGDNNSDDFPLEATQWAILMVMVTEITSPAALTSLTIVRKISVLPIAMYLVALIQIVMELVILQILVHMTPIYSKEDLDQ